MKPSPARCSCQSIGARVSAISLRANEAGLSSSYFTRMLRLSFLAPDITQAILHGRQPADLTAHKLMADTRPPIDWHEQHAGLGFI